MPNTKKPKKMPPELAGIMAVINGLATSQAAMMACLVRLAESNADNEEFLADLDTAIDAFDAAGDGVDKLNELVDKVYPTEH